MEIRHIAVVNESPTLAAESFLAAVAAVQRQVLADFAPAWQITASVSAFATVDAVPDGHWPVFVRDNIGVNQLGVHLTDDALQPYALVLHRPEDWTVTLSHEVLEILSDPVGDEFETGPHPDGAGTVAYLREVCDPCQPDPFAAFVNGRPPHTYLIDGIAVSDFVFPEYYAGFGVGRFSHAGTVTAPREILRGGNLVWRNSDRDFIQRIRQTGGGMTERNLGPAPPGTAIHVRGWIDRGTREYQDTRKPAKPRRRTPATASAARKTGWWKAQLDRLNDPST